MSHNLILTQVVLELSCAFMCLIAMFLTYWGHRTMAKSGRSITFMLFFNVILLVTDAAAYAFRGREDSLGFWAVRISNALVFLFQYLLLAASLYYFIHLLEEQNIQPGKLFLRLQYICCAAGTLVLLISQFTGFVYTIDEHNIYHRQSGIVVTMGLAFVGLIINLIMLLRYRKGYPRRQWVALFLYTVVPVFSVAAQTLFYGLSIINIANTLMLIIAFVIHEAERISLIEAQAQKLVEQEQELTEQRIQLVTSQIRPHFLYNALATISSLCRSEPATAEQAVNQFADYLRMNLDTMGKQTMIPFSKELEHSKTYLWLEYLRFGDILNVEYDIRYTDFYIPPLSIQPFVENAVKHGIFPKEDGGTVTIRTRKLENGVEVVIQDDGEGFDPTAPLTSDRSHIGIANVTNRIETLCSGTITVKSAPGQGCTVTIFLPERNSTL